VGSQIKNGCLVISAWGILYYAFLWLRDFDVDELLMLSGRIVERVRMVLENRFGLLLSDVGVPLHQPVTRFYSEEAGELVKLGTTIVEDVGSIDNSPPERVPHEDYVGKDLAKAKSQESPKT